METYRQLRERHQKEINDFPFFFAFSNKQFDEGMKKFGLKPDETDKIYKFGDTGGYYKRTDAKKLKNMFDRQDSELKEAMLNDNFVLQMFEYELANHEYCITYNDEDTLYALGLDNESMDERMCKLFLQAKKRYLKKCEY